MRNAEPDLIMYLKEVILFAVVFQEYSTNRLFQIDKNMSLLSTNMLIRIDARFVYRISDFYRQIKCHWPDKAQ
ncbi:unnamed protein product [Photorhabdus laumondii subsp. laumondii TTO1]|uniref:Photorhabdus luminescens subsp. laumondii TTO1 complete genome segment 3/17 n=1 Tax=Photorhabdus laumondii subsp. laumondii (strain DSM 15139 / CIP 105565 / TT01) TaxID=243265 RepID=Q7N8I9_PHOLL|nr:unnamed protein product [Photorhabdus laumondii subsp. laumondii TTO1]